MSRLATFEIQNNRRSVLWHKQYTVINLVLRNAIVVSIFDEFHRSQPQKERSNIILESI